MNPWQKSRTVNLRGVTYFLWEEGDGVQRAGWLRQHEGGPEVGVYTTGKWDKVVQATRAARANSDKPNTRATFPKDSNTPRAIRAALLWLVTPEEV